MQDKVNKIPHFKTSKQPDLFSDIYNTDTFVHFSKELFGLPDQKSSFIKVHYRVKNLELVKRLENSTFKDHNSIKKVCKGLSCCSSVSEVQVTTRKNASITRTSSKCRRSVCARCNQIQSSKYRKRFINCFNSPETELLFKKKYFYFITLTLRHNSTNIRNNVYLQELKNYVRDLKRSKLWKTHFPFSASNPISGFAQSYELTLTPNGYHIHSHIMMCTTPLKGRITTIQQNFRDKWKKLTGDSTGVRIDMFKMDQAELEKVKEGKPSSKFTGLISEVFKYTVKLGDVHKLTSKKTELFANWIILTKGKNMIVSGGFFRGLQLFTRKSKWDDDNETEDLGHYQSFDHYIGRTSRIKFNADVRKHYSKEEREQILATIYLKEIPECFISINNCGDFFDKYMNLLINPIENCFGSSDLDKLSRWVSQAEQEQAEKQFYADFDKPLDQEFINQANKLYLTEENNQLEFIY